MVSLLEGYRRVKTLLTDRIETLPVVVLMPHSRCNCRCVMCDIWKANANGTELERSDLAAQLESFRDLNVQWFVLSGGEALMHSNLWTLCEVLRELGAKISILSTGLLLERYADGVLDWTDEVTVSLDGPPDVHDAIRRVPNAFEKLKTGVRTLKERNPTFRITARCVVQRANFRALPRIIDAARGLGIDQISFLAVDVESEAFNRPGGWDEERADEVSLTPAQTEEFAHILEETIDAYGSAFEEDFVAESPDRLRRLPRYFDALNGDASFPENTCNAPWTSAVVEANGTVRPCFFHEELGSIHEESLGRILNGEQAMNFRRQLDVSENPVCETCTCSLHVSPHESI